MSAATPSWLVKAMFSLFVFSIPFEGVDVLGTAGTFSLPRLIGVAMIGAALTQSRICFARPPIAFWLFTAYLATAIFMGLTGPSVYWSLALPGFVTLLQMLVFFWIAANLLAFPEVARPTVAALAASTLLVGLLGLVGIGADVDPSSGRMSIFGDDPNSIAGMLSLGLISWIGLGREFKIERGIATRLWLGACSVLAIAIIRTGSRGGVVALFFGIAAMLFRKRRTGKDRGRAWMVVLILLGLIAGLLLSTTSSARWEVTLEERSAAGREDIFPAVWAMFLERPLLGWGPVQNIAQLGARMSYGSRSSGFGVRDTHNGLLWVLSEVGIVGTVPFVAGLWLCLRSAWRSRSRLYGVLPLAMTVCVFMINMSLSWQKRKFFWLVLAFSVASAQSPVARRAARVHRSVARLFRAGTPSVRSGYRVNATGQTYWVPGSEPNRGRPDEPPRTPGEGA